MLMQWQKMQPVEYMELTTGRSLPASISAIGKETGQRLSTSEASFHVLI